VRSLASLLQTDGRTDDAIGQLESFLGRHPRDEEVLRQLASLYSTKQSELQTAYAQAAARAQGISATDPARNPSDKLYQAIGEDPIAQAVGQQTSEGLQAEQQRYAAASQKIIDTYRRLIRANPEEPSYQLDLARAASEQGDLATTVGAYKQFLRLAPDDPLAPRVRQILKQLQPPPAKPKKQPAAEKPG
jgi:DNA-binding SARP family transcriptional activator